MLSQIKVIGMPRRVQFPGGEPGSLEQGAGLVGEDVEGLALLVRGEETARAVP